MLQFIRYKIELAGGPFNGAERYYDSIGVAIREGKKYVKKYSNPTIIGFNSCEFEVFGITPSYKCKLLYYSW